ncbi:TetR/AcrR family transcriptional regulator [Brevibacillus reuszeri]|uniref:TetR/AcrR family transcriptional regulator n=1 Tax=Brevibacillus reuszeri TaxID=54915 RepID=UPI00289FD48F|nr:TetR/AcrR family transcriptional regulator [Brevibacillus reuszeri]
MDGYERRTTIKRKLIEKAAFELLNIGGIKALRIKDVADRAGTSPVSIYNYYGSKEKLIYEVMRSFYEQQTAKLRSLVTNDEPFIDQLNDFFLQKPKDTNLLRKDIMEEILEVNHELNTLVKEYQQQTIPVFLEWIDKGRKQGYVKEGTSNETILYSYMMMSQAMENLYKQIADRPDVEQIFQQVKYMFFYGFIKETK